MRFEDELGSLLRQAGDAYTLPAPAGVNEVTSRSRRRQRRRTSIAATAAALVLAVASYGAFQATSANESSTIATVPDPTTAVIDDDGSPSRSTDRPTSSPMIALALARLPNRTPGSHKRVATMDQPISNIVSVDGRYFGFSFEPGAVVAPDAPFETNLVVAESADGTKLAGCRRCFGAGRSRLCAVVDQGRWVLPTCCRYGRGRHLRHVNLVVPFQRPQ